MRARMSDHSPAAVDPQTTVALVLPGMRAGGAEGTVEILADAFLRAGRNVLLYTFEAPQDVPYFKLNRGVRVVALDVPLAGATSVRGTMQVLRRVRALREAFRRDRPDVAISFLTKTNIITVLAARRAKIPVIVSERNNPGRQSFGPVWSWLRRLTYPDAAALVTMTKGALAWFPERERKRGCAIRNPVVKLGDGGCASDGRTITAVGRLDPQKGFDLLLDAFARVAPDCPDWQLVIWGEGPERSRLEAQREALGLCGRVRLPGLSSEPRQWVCESEVFVMSSRFEGWGNVLSEAIAADLPVISYDCDFGPSEMITHGVNGLLVEPENVDALADAIRRVLADPELRRSLGGHGAAYISRHTPAAVASEWLALVDAVLRDGAASSQLRTTSPARNLAAGT